MFRVVTILPLCLLQKPVLRVPTRTCTSDRMSQWFPMNNVRVVLADWIITSALAHTRISHLCAKRASNESCCCWKFVCQFACPDADWLQYTSHFSACGTALQGHTKCFWRKSISVCLCLLTKFVVTCSGRIQLPFSHCSPVLLRDASKNASCGPAVSYSGSV